MSNDVLAERIRARPEEMAVDFILPSAATTPQTRPCTPSCGGGMARTNWTDLRASLTER